jgi:hypothetical protein
MKKTNNLPLFDNTIITHINLSFTLINSKMGKWRIRTPFQAINCIIYIQNYSKQGKLIACLVLFCINHITI